MKRHLNKIHDTVKQANHFLITTHIRADGDAIGSEVALYHALKQMDKVASIANDSPVPRIFKFIIPDSDLFIYPEVPKEKAEVVFALDCPTKERLGKIQEFIPKDTTIINIDHHISNELFGNINLVAENACATGEIILSFLKEMEINFTPDIATALYVAIVTDTGRFTHSNTTPKALRAAAFLIEHGARHTEISNNIYNTNSFNSLQLYAQALNTIQLHKNNQIASVSLTKKLLEKTKVNAIDTHEFADIPISIDGVSVGILFREMEKTNWVKVSLRSRNNVNVNEVAKKFGGGGHKYAAGCEIQGDISHVQKLILGELENTLLSGK
ncbi:MAG: bifunctional oligoribonuclease/PAP phosphatase NrnA [Candidatus Brocadiaceae bacterium]|nr:bifunctional oligoribonuclease/PAP phosphatase NrnA [Candidatus Brocadiaceae bacterium]